MPLTDAPDQGHSPRQCAVAPKSPANDPSGQCRSQTAPPKSSVTSPPSRAPALPSIAASLSVHPRSSGGLVPFRAPHSDPPFLPQPGRRRPTQDTASLLGSRPVPGYVHSTTAGRAIREGRHGARRAQNGWPGVLGGSRGQGAPREQLRGAVPSARGGRCQGPPRGAPAHPCLRAFPSRCPPP